MCVYKFEEIVEKVRPIAEQYKINSVWLFGSYARGDATEESDIDIIVGEGDYDGWKIGGLYEDLREAFQKDIDLITEAQISRSRNDPLHKRFVEEVELDRKVIY
ncbi:MAG: nucleotidyltransferase domain-containing protein [Oscillospiraceae bacterium]|nr:nucleotidyltransferase domain-containing protein [Oscillospiraceae bacterium]